MQLSIPQAKKIVIIGAGGFAREVLQYIFDINKGRDRFDVLGFIDESPELKGTIHKGVPVIGDFSCIEGMCEDLYAICAVANPSSKEGLVDKALRAGLQFTNLVHPSSYVPDTVRLGEGVIIGPGCVISTGVKIGNHVSINPQSGIGHDAEIGDFSTLYWNVSLAGFVNVGKGVEIGSKAFIRQGLKIGQGSVIGAGAVVTKDVEPGITVIGVPARRLSEDGL